MDIKRLIENNLAAIVVGCSSVFASYLAINIRLTQIETVQLADHQKIIQLDERFGRLEVAQEGMRANADASQKNVDKMSSAVDKLTDSVNALFGVVSRWEGQIDASNKRR